MPDDLKDKIAALAQKFDNNKSHYLSKKYLEAEVRQDFLDPFFEALGWDIGNKKGLSPYDREVVVEKGDTSGRPDYNFRMHGATRFFVEAKAPSVTLDNINHIFQVKTYAWNNTGVYFVILTDFEGLKLYDASLKPDSKHPNDGLIFDFHYTEYIENIDKLRLLTRAEVEAGSLEKLVRRDAKSSRLRIPVDKVFLEDMTSWRETLAKDIHKRNSELDVALLNESVQKLLDRIIFIRIAEDRKIRKPRELAECVEQWKAEGKRKSLLKDHLRELFAEVNDDLNGDIFKPHHCESIDIDSSILADIIEDLYFPKCRYRFEVLGVELLGSIYERYLGNTIRVTPKRVVVEEKPEVRKAGGVYYTPKYIVDYIVKSTVGRLIEGKTPKEIEKIKIIDPACGSGSFLLGAYQCLLDYHTEYYRMHPKEAVKLKSLPLLYYKQIPEDFSLPIQEKARILKNNIFGVDIDAQAVEISMMSLYLKCLEGERGLLPEKQSLLPPLNRNIKCGNSLIGYDVLEKENLLFDNPPDKGGKGGVDDELKSRINPFDWNSKATGFGEAMEAGGFDAVIGNPPYVRQEMISEFKPYLQSRYKTYSGSADLYIYFIEKGVAILKDGGIFSYIVANKWMRASYGEPVRRWMKTQAIEEIIDFGDLPVFEQATTYPCILRIKKGNAKPAFTATAVKSLDFDDLMELVKKDGKKVLLKSLEDNGWSLAGAEESALLSKIKATGKPLGEYVQEKIFYGIKTGLNEAFVIDKETRKRLLAEEPKSKDLIKPFLAGRDVKRYENPESEKYVIFTRRGVDIKQYPAIEKYLTQFKERLTPKPKDWKNKDWKGRKPGSYRWYEIQDSIDYYAEFDKPKIIYAEIAQRGQFTLDTHNYYSDTTTYILGIDSKYLLGILNSIIFTFIFSKSSSEIRGGFYRWKRQYMSPLPIRIIDFKNPDDKAMHDKVVTLVDRMLELNKKKAALPQSNERDRVEAEIAVTDEKIDDIVCKLYGITDEERRIIEGKA